MVRCVPELGFNEGPEISPAKPGTPSELVHETPVASMKGRRYLRPNSAFASKMSMRLPQLQ